MDTSVISEKGIRNTMEDAHFVDTDFGGRQWIFCGIYDGHGGQFASGYAAENMHRVFLDNLLHGATPQQAFIDSYEKISAGLSEQTSGTTAVNIFIKNGIIYTANAGDARAIVIGKNQVIQLTIDHRVGNTEERQRIENSGGRIVYSYVSNGAGGLMPTRTIGDQPFKSVGVIATPSVGEHRISPDDSVLLIGCDGLFDVMSNEEIADFASRTVNISSLLENLKREVLVNRSGTDNLTIIALKLNE